MYCSRCVYDDTIPGIAFDDKGVCSYCHSVDALKEQYGTGMKDGYRQFDTILQQIKKDGKKKKYDCVLGVSGGTDSSFLLDRAIHFGLRPLAVHYDNTWNTAIATQNIRVMLDKLDIDLYTHVVNNKEADDIFSAFFKASVPDLDCSTDIALAETLYRAASKHNVKYILEGHSFTTEGVSPLSHIYMDGKYIKSVHKRYGKGSIKTFPNMSYSSFLKWTVFKRIKKIRPLWYIHYSKQSAQEYLHAKYGWENYGGHHLENRITAFQNNWYGPKKFGLDYRVNSLSAAVREGLMSRGRALEELQTVPFIEDEIITYFKKRLGLSEQEFQYTMNLPHKSFRDYATYKKRFERDRWLFYLLMKRNLVPQSFYMKYCHSWGE